MSAPDPEDAGSRCAARGRSRVGRNDSLVRSRLGTGVIAGGWRVSTRERDESCVRYDVGVGTTVYWLGGELPLGGRNGPLLAAESGLQLLVTRVRHRVRSDRIRRERRLGGRDCRAAAPADRDRRRRGVPGDARAAAFAHRGVRSSRDPAARPASVGSGPRRRRCGGGPSVCDLGHRSRCSGRQRQSSALRQLSPRRPERPSVPSHLGRAGTDRALGANGLGTIDTRTWTTKPVAPAATGAIATPHGIVTWVGESPSG